MPAAQYDDAPRRPAAPRHPQDDINRKMRLTILVTGSIFLLAMAYGSGMRSQVKKLRAQYEQVKVWKQETRLAQVAARGSDARLQQWEARRLLGLAQQQAASGDAAGAKARVEEAVARLETAAGADAAVTADLSAEIEELKVAAFDPAAALPGVLARMDEAMSKVVPEPAALTPVTIKPPTLNDVPVGNDVARPIGQERPRSGW